MKLLQACLVLQRRHLPDQPVEYLVKFRSQLKLGAKYRERWVHVDRLTRKFAAGAALIKQFESSKVGQLAVDTYLSKRRSLQPEVSSNDKDDVRPDVVRQNGKGEPLVRPPKRKNRDDDGRPNQSANCESAKSNCAGNNNAASPRFGNAPFTHKLASFYGPTSGTPPHLHHPKHIAKRLLLHDTVPKSNWPKNSASKLPNLEPAEPRRTIVGCKYKDSDSEDDVRYSLATDHSSTSSDDEDVKYSIMPDGLAKKRRKLSIVNGLKRSESGRWPKDEEDRKKPQNCKNFNLPASSSKCKAGICVFRVPVKVAVRQLHPKVVQTCATACLV